MYEEMLDHHDPDNYDPEGYNEAMEARADALREDIALQKWEEEQERKKEITKGFVVKSTANPKWTAYSAHYFPTKHQAKKFAENEKKRMERLTGMRFYYRVEQVDLKKCKCGAFMETGEVECSRCEKLRGDR